MKGVFIVLEGIDGCGKTTQINHLSSWLPKSGLMPTSASLHITREPGGTHLGKYLRDLLLHSNGKDSPEAITELLLYAADRAHHISKLIQPSLEKGDWVISDRFTGSTLAYQGFGRGLDVNIIKNLEKIATQGIKPDLTFLINLSIKESQNRRKAKIEDRIEAEGELFLQKVASGFTSIANSQNWIIIEGNQEQQLVGQEIEKHLTVYLKNLLNK